MSKQIFKIADVTGILDFQSTHFSSFRSRSCPAAREQVSAENDQRFGRRYRKLIFKMAAVAAILDFQSAQNNYFVSTRRPAVPKQVSIQLDRSL